MVRSGFYPKDARFDIVSTDRAGMLVTIDGDVREYVVGLGQRFIPHAIIDAHHPVKVGDILTFNQTMAQQVGVSIVIVSNVRAFRTFRKGPAIR